MPNIAPTRVIAYEEGGDLIKSCESLAFFSRTQTEGGGRDAKSTKTTDIHRCCRRGIEITAESDHAMPWA